MFAKPKDLLFQFSLLGEYRRLVQNSMQPFLTPGTLVAHMNNQRVILFTQPG